MPPKKNSSPVSRYLSKIGKKGGKKGGMTGKGAAKARSSEQARAAVNARWDKARKAKDESDSAPS